MGVKLVAYKYVPMGFEMILEEEKFSSEAKIFNHWFNIKITDDPSTWDKEILWLNDMQSTLGELTSEQRLIRAHIAEFCRRHPLFPESIEIVCEEIGNTQLSNPLKIGCEGRGLLDALGYHDSHSMNDQQTEMINKYGESLKNWLAQNQPKDSLDFKIFRFLGEPTKKNKSFVEKLISLITANEVSVYSLKHFCGSECQQTSVLEDPWTPFPFGCFKCQAGCPDDASIPRCSCAQGMIIDAGLLCAGQFSGKQSMAHEFRRFIEEHSLVYAIAINSWLHEISVKEIASLNINLQATAKRISFLLGEKDNTKEWLVACFLKTIKDNHQGRPEDGVKRAELIDDYPEATSWFKNKYTA
ncbi:hypothetical protein AMJ52_03490 [candidate division TA06 bacterium DG_78]|uniref:Uncharacterized protein n=1 Tax=candidate division TA06 bacterium DG_78 TaxID=1703772 RepID=A0A0S7YFQ5_UNCT6|nr:MAG: hypothetical protein AMJ52_03490 [candidate division TA06 bacterium DG_78]